LGEFVVAESKEELAHEDNQMEVEEKHSYLMMKKFDEYIRML